MSFKNIFSLSRRQKQLFKFWFSAIIVAEVILSISLKFSIYLYIVGGILFLGGFILRVLNKYPGNKEPLVLDISSGLISFVIAFILYNYGYNRVSIYLGPLIVLLPHLLYILLSL